MKFTILEPAALLIISSLSPLSAAPSPLINPSVNASSLVEPSSPLVEGRSPTIGRQDGEFDSSAHCERQNSVVALKYEITAPDIPADYVDELCGTLWSKLRRFKTSCIVSSSKCKVDGAGLFWKFWVPVGCNQGMVQSAWWEATVANNHNFGTLTCPGWKG
ncbi:hypothetical protein CSOJ01_00498 [Colletotrichum sojae]|uniref:Uncharacterized protein n=1 Tax=Colletotrichum sojae TaxID=2175907 RepID=A0A8H6JYK6_9PEZI|nr:hypothetical protein CSOJ01_00498 [Colletotrichum sojae]